MFRLLYFSTARSDVDRAEVDRIVAHAVEKNARLGITGALAFNGRNFCQLLEGDKGVVRKLIGEIEADRRHTGFKVLDEREVTTRAFADWSLRLVNDLDFSVVINAMND